MTLDSEPDPQLLQARELAHAALLEITPAGTVGEPAGHVVEADGVVSLLFETTLDGYPGWFWTVSLARVEGEEPTVLEAELLPGDKALLAPEWVPWAVRLADYQAAQVQAAENSGEDEEAEDGLDDLDEDDLDDDIVEGDDLDDDVLDDDDDDDDEFVVDGPRPVHGGDLDGVDIDELGESEQDEDPEPEPEPEPEPVKKRRPRLSWRRMRRS